MSLGYDPVDKQFKVLCSTWSPFNSLSIPAEHYVLTLGEQMVWRTIECCRPIRHLVQGGDGICINGLLYYMAESNNYQDIFIVCFDTRFEKLSFINKPDGMWPVGLESRLVNHKGQLGIMQCSNPNRIDGHATSFCLWLLQGGGTEWTKHISQLPFLWWNLAGETELGIVGIRAGTCELVLSPRFLSGRPIYLFYFDLERNIVTSVGIQGFEGVNSNILLAYCFVDYVENLKLI
ncbi:PREDICTED: F-box protein DOR-like [Camelina sativa]|nr:PREDICTED: F-box protein DOR-like [Camelina sativa]